MNTDVRQYLVVTGNYWAFTLTDGALRMLIVLHFYQLGYSPLAIASLFLFYEFFGIVTNLTGGWLGARLGLNKTMNIGLFLQIIALSMLLVPSAQLTVIWVMAAQAVSGIAKDLNKMSAKSAIKLLLPDEAQGALYKWVAILTGSKNALKGVGFFLGGLLLTLFGFQGAMAAMAGALLLVWLLSLVLLKKDLGKKSFKPKFTELLSKSTSLNWLSAARFFLFASRDVWFVIALPIYLSTSAGWPQSAVGAFLACWVIGYGAMQAFTPTLTRSSKKAPPAAGAALNWALVLAVMPWLIGLAMLFSGEPLWSLLIGLMLYGAVFAINSSLHSYLIVASANRDGVSLDVGFYYMANAAGRLVGTLLSGWAYQTYGLLACLWLSGVLLLGAVLCTLALKRHQKVLADFSE